jgi:hypothetical protein
VNARFIGPETQVFDFAEVRSAQDDSSVFGMDIGDIGPEMRTLTQTDLLSLWETGRSLHSLDQGVLAVEAALPEARESVADWPLGRRNRALLELHARVFGGSLRGWVACPRCAEKLEFALDSRTLAEQLHAEQDATVEVDGERFQLPTSRDLAALARETDAARATQSLMQRLHADGRDAWSEAEIEVVGERLAEADPLAEIRIGLACPDCGESFEESLDLPSFVWSEMAAFARRMLKDVHALASAYGWSEAEILGLSPARRELYLEMVRG